MTPRLKLRLGLALLGVLALGSALYPVLSAFGPPCPFGADVEFPKDTVCARTLGGVWRSIALGLGAGLAACSVALALAVAARLRRGAVDVLVEKSADLVFALPDILVLLAVGFAVKVVRGGEDGVPLTWMALALTAVGWAAPTRMVQNRLRSLERQDFVLAAEGLGATRWRVVRRHLLPFAWDYLAAIFLLRVPAIVLTESTVSFLGFGLPPDQPSLGKYLGANAAKLMLGEWRVVAPAWVLLAVVVLAFQWTGEGVLGRGREERT